MTLPLSYGVNYQKRLVRLYTIIYKARFDGESPRIDYRIFAPMLKRMFEKYGEIRVASAILMHFEQNGEAIIEQKFPITWLARSIDKYLERLQDYGVDIDSEESLFDAMKSRLEYLAIDIAVC